MAHNGCVMMADPVALLRDYAAECDGERVREVVARLTQEMAAYEDVVVARRVSDDAHEAFWRASWRREASRVLAQVVGGEFYESLLSWACQVADAAYDECRNAFADLESAQEARDLAMSERPQVPA